MRTATLLKASTGLGTRGGIVVGYTRGGHPIYLSKMKGHPYSLSAGDHHAAVWGSEYEQKQFKEAASQYRREGEHDGADLMDAAHRMSRVMLNALGPSDEEHAAHLRYAKQAADRHGGKRTETGVLLDSGTHISTVRQAKMMTVMQHGPEHAKAFRGVFKEYQKKKKAA